MNDKEILEKAIKKAIEGGWKPNMKFVFQTAPRHDAYEPNSFTLELPQSLIFNPQFAKALWGDWPQLMKDVVPKGVKSVTDKPAWQYHLQNMVIAPDPIEYLGENI